MRQFIRKNIKAIIGYILFCLAAFVFFLFILFPRNEIRERIIYEIEKGTATEIKTASDRWVFPLGLTFTGMEFTKEGGKGSRPVAKIDRLDLHIPIKSIISFSPVSILTADLYGGTVKGMITLRRNNRVVQAKWANLDMSRIDKLKEAPVEIAGRTSGDMVLKFNSQKPEGQIRILIKDGKLSKLNVMGFILPDLPIEEMQGLIDIKGITLSLHDIRFKNSDIKGVIKGDIKLASNAEQANLDISIRFAIGEKMKVQYQGILSMISQTKDREGYYTLHIKGDPKKPTVGI